MARVERVVDATRELFIQKGYEATTAEEIAARAGVSKKSLYSWFPDKAAIFAEVIRRLQARNFPKDDLEKLGSLPVAEALHWKARQILNASIESDAYAISKFVIREGYRNKDLHTVIRTEGRGSLEGQAEELIRRHAPDAAADYTKELAVLFMSAVYSEITSSIIQDRGPPTPERIHKFSTIIADLFANDPIFEPTRVAASQAADPETRPPSP